MPGEILLDTGPLVAVLDDSQSSHDQCVDVFEAISATLITTLAVLTEACHILRRTPNGPANCVRFVLEWGVLLMPLTPPALMRAAQLLTKYSDLPMDFADATLVALAEELDLRRIFTLDRRDFSIYRALDREAFEIIP